MPKVMPEWLPSLLLLVSHMLERGSLPPQLLPWVSTSSPQSLHWCPGTDLASRFTSRMVPAQLACSSATLGDHALCCGHYGERITRHNRIRDHIFSVAVAAALGPVREGRFLIPGTDRRPADIFIPSLYVQRVFRLFRLLLYIDL